MKLTLSFGKLGGVYRSVRFVVMEWVDCNITLHIRAIQCRLLGHTGVVWYNASGFEPNMECRRCGKDLG